MSNKLVLYNLDLSPPTRAVRVVAKLLGLELELRNLNLFEREQMKESFIKINPEHTVPTLDDNGFIIWDSHAICAYLVDKYAKDDKLYPKDLKLRAKCNQRLFFDAASLFVRLRDIGIPIHFKGCAEIPQEKIDLVVGSFEMLESFLVSDPFLVGANLTIADICVCLSVQLLTVYIPFTAAKYPKIAAWMKRISQKIPFFDEMNAIYPKQYHKIVYDTLEKNKQNK